MSFFRTYIDKPIQEELYNRIDSMNFERTPQGALDSVQSSVQHQFVKSCWARASAIIGKDGTGKLVQINNIPSTDGGGINEPLNIKNRKPYRGQPGITSINSSFKEYFMKQTTVNFYIPDPKDFDKFKDEFLRFGRYVIVEWGWSLPYNFSLPTINAETILKASKDIQERIRKGNGNYNATVGVVTNYNFNQTKEGAYEANIELSSMGRNIIGQKSSTDGKIENMVGYVNADLIEKEGTELDQQSKQIYSLLRKTFVNFNAAIENLEFVIDEYLKTNATTTDFSYNETYAANVSYFSGNTTTKERPVEFSLKKKDGVLQVPKSGLFKDKDRLTYCTWGWFEDFILNSFFSFTSKDNQNKEFKTEFRSSQEITTFREQPYAETEMRPIVPEGVVLTGDFEIDRANGVTYQEVVVNEDVVLQPVTKHVLNTCGTHEDLYSLGFDSIILPGKTKKFTQVDKGIYQPEVNQKENEGRKLQAFMNQFIGYFPSFEKEVNGETRGQIRNMVFEVEYLKESFTGTQNIEGKINEFWRKVSNDYGGFWNFALVESNITDGQMMITDLNIGVVKDSDISDQMSTKKDPTKIFKFPIYSKDSIVTDIQLQSENSAEMATMAVYGANVSLKETSADMGKGYTPLAMRALSMLDNSNVVPGSETLNTEDYFDTILNNIGNPVYQNFLENNGSEFRGSSATYNPKDGSLLTWSRTGGIDFSSITQITETEEKIEDNLSETTLNTALYDVTEKSIREAFYWFGENDNKVQIYNPTTGRMYEEFKRTMLFNINKAPGETSNYSVVNPPVPIQLSLTLQGIGGMKVGDLFYVDYLPKIYRAVCHWMIVNVEHEVGTSGWTTKLDSRMIVDIPKLLKIKNDSQENPFVPVIVKNSLSETVSEKQIEYKKKNEEKQQEIDDKKNQDKNLKNKSNIVNVVNAYYDQMGGGDSF